MDDECARQWKEHVMAGSEPTGINLMCVTDARVWAEEFVRIAAMKGLTVDVDWMHSWFASAITVGEGMGRKPASQPSEPHTMKCACGYATDSVADMKIHRLYYGAELHEPAVPSQADGALRERCRQWLILNCPAADVEIAALAAFVEKELSPLREALKAADDALSTWFSSEYCESAVAKKVRAVLDRMWR